MAVHPNSVIPTWINNYWPAFYVALTDKEEYAYNNGAGTSQFSTLATRLNTYRTTNRSGPVYELISAIYSYYAMQQNFMQGDIELEDYDYTQYISFGNFGPATLVRPVSYYNDFSLGTSARLTADNNYLQNDADDDEVENIQIAREILTTDLNGFVSKYLFEDPPISSSPVGKQQIGLFIFNILLYRRVYEYLNVAPNTLPPYIT